MKRFQRIFFHPVVTFLVTLFVLVSSIVEHYFLGLAVLASILLVTNCFQAVAIFVSKKMTRASMLAFKTMWSKLTKEQQKELEAELKSGLLNKTSETPKSIGSIITP